MGSSRRIGMEQASANVTNRDEGKVAIHAPCGVLTLRSGYGWRAAKGVTPAARVTTAAAARAQRGPRPDTA
jgi:hypothetical protein